MFKAPKPGEDATVAFYEYDYPWPEDEFFSYVRPGKVGFHSTAHDISFLIQGAASNESKNVLDLCCGTGRLTIPHAREGRNVTGVDIAQGQIDGAQLRLKKEAADVQKRARFITGDITQLDLGEEFDFVQIGFNSLSQITDAKAQQEAIRVFARHMRSGGLGVIDLQNPMNVDYEIKSSPTIIYEKTDADKKFRYTKLGWVSEVDIYQKVVEQGWYDVIAADGQMSRFPYTLTIRYLSLREMELLLEEAGLQIARVCGDHFANPYETYSPKMIFIIYKP